jgi:hypothetical protein
LPTKESSAARADPVNASPAATMDKVVMNFFMMSLSLGETWFDITLAERSRRREGNIGGPVSREIREEGEGRIQ